MSFFGDETKFTKVTNYGEAHPVTQSQIICESVSKFIDDDVQHISEKYCRVIGTRVKLHVDLEFHHFKS